MRVASSLGLTTIVVMHMNHPRFHTAEALPGIVAGLRPRGFELVTVGELLGVAAPPGAQPWTAPPYGPYWMNRIAIAQTDMPMSTR